MSTVDDYPKYQCRCGSIATFSGYHVLERGTVYLMYWCASGHYHQIASTPQTDPDYAKSSRRLDRSNPPPYPGGRK
jgi:hypothetical protein